MARVAPISKSARWSTSPADSLVHITTNYAADLDGMGFKLTDQTQDRLVFTYRYLPPLGLFIGLITFPIGILFWVLEARRGPHVHAHRGPGWHAAAGRWPWL